MTMPVFNEKRTVAFWARVDKSGGARACWPWTGARTQRGDYGYLVVHEQGQRVQLLAHRVAYFLTTGDDPGDWKIRHSCDVGLCCNGAHTRKGTQAENIADMDARGRRGTACGADNGKATVTEEEAEEIRDLLRNTVLTMYEIADQVNDRRAPDRPRVTRSLVQTIKLGLSWFKTAVQRPQESRGSWLRGHRNHNAKTTNRTDLTQILVLRKQDWSQDAIAEHLGISQKTVSDYLARKHWTQR